MQPATAGNIKEAYAPVSPKGDPPQQHPDPEWPPGPQSCILIELIPDGTTQLHTAPVVTLVPHTLNPDTPVPAVEEVPPAKLGI
jgi:hypothetical protein